MPSFSTLQHIGFVVYRRYQNLWWLSEGPQNRDSPKALMEPRMLAAD